MCTDQSLPPASAVQSVELQGAGPEMPLWVVLADCPDAETWLRSVATKKDTAVPSLPACRTHLPREPGTSIHAGLRLNPSRIQLLTPLTDQVVSLYPPERISREIMRIVTVYAKPTRNKFDRMVNVRRGLFPFDRAGWLGCHIINDPVDALDLVDDPVRYAPQESVIERIVIRRHAIR